ncbi:MAG: hypothetical protein MUE73_17300 [Planctomycetes bacterium]|nr:hypothetical protein [Planctomycetota bacterium]
MTPRRPAAHAIRLLPALLLAVASCAWTEGERYRVADAPGRTGGPEVLLIEGDPGERLRACVRLPVVLPGDTECCVRIEGVRTLYRWNLGRKFASLPLGILCLAAAPLAVVLEPFVPSPAEVGSFGVPVYMLMAGVWLLGAFCWFPQATPWDALARGRTEEALPPSEVTVVLPAGRWSLPLASCAVEVRMVGGTPLGAGVTDEQGFTYLPLPPGLATLAGRLVEVEIALPGNSLVTRMVTVLLADDPRARIPDPLIVDENGMIRPGRWWFAPADVSTNPRPTQRPAEGITGARRAAGSQAVEPSRRRTWVQAARRSRTSASAPAGSGAECEGE